MLIIGGAGEAKAWNVVTCRLVRRGTAIGIAQAKLTENGELGEVPPECGPTFLRGG